MLHTVVSSLVPVVGTLLLGGGGRQGDKDARAARALNTMVLTRALPWPLLAR